MRLYVAGQTEKSVRAINNLNRICEEHLEGRYSIEVIDLVRHPKLAADDHILALPTLVRRLPEPIRKIIGDLSNEERVIIGLDVRKHGSAEGEKSRVRQRPRFHHPALHNDVVRGGRVAAFVTRRG